MTLRVLLIGAGGVFGSRIARQLAGDPRFHLTTMAGRQLTRLLALRERQTASPSRVGNRAVEVIRG